MATGSHVTTGLMMVVVMVGEVAARVRAMEGGGGGRGEGSIR